MQNGYFRLVNRSDYYGIAIYRPLQGGEMVRLDEVEGYLNDLNIPYDKAVLVTTIQKGSEEVLRLGSGRCPEIPETYRLSVSEDGMKAEVRFLAASETGKRMTYDDFIRDLRFRKIVSGIKEEILRKHFSTNGMYCTDLLIAEGEDPIQGKDARIEYLFNTNPQAKPEQREDGSVDFFHLTTINYCKKGQELARVIPADPGKEGTDIYGRVIKPRNVKHLNLQFGRNIILSDDRLSITSAVDGHVTLVDEKVFVSDVYEVKNVDVSTGNIDFSGSVEITGDVTANFEVKAEGDIVVNGIVEGARLIAGGSIVLAKGMNGMEKGYLEAGSNIVAKFLENTKVFAGGQIQAEAIMNCQVSAGDEVFVDGRRGIIVGGCVQAGSRITAKNIGAIMGSATILEVGINPALKTQYIKLQKEINENSKTVQNAETVLRNFSEKLKKGIQPNEGQLKYMKSVAKLVSDKNEELIHQNEELEGLRGMMKTEQKAEVVASGEIYPGTTIMIGDATKTLQSSYRFCRFVKEQGEVCMASL